MNKAFVDRYFNILQNRQIKTKRKLPINVPEEVAQVRQQHLPRFPLSNHLTTIHQFPVEKNNKKQQ